MQILNFDGAHMSEVDYCLKKITTRESKGTFLGQELQF